ncbi:MULTISPECIES: ABC transporter ATP-binding protein [Rhizobium/Agrobacterium group]|uniref:Spermidine/putrescine import ATP-binding protein PotA n=2 Tax=Neorhizobium TaxID=1525371 RepID=A0ABV0M3E1_9HYPH|nr:MULTISPECIES: ABC transporter ATP-binding protein [Rhizobium/Agrobacterium group]MCC2609393.1 ABC transporter ATP-binding protein [Neorhizobium petrolearium]WGI69607.1 ABC transporter ATP-binding protein [Neorhizobium petrolearium]
MILKGETVILEKIEKNFAETAVVRDVSIAVQAGEFLSLLGPSGSGKTTLLMMIAGFEAPNRGRISVGTRDITFEAPNKRNVGMVFQRYALFPHMTVAQNIAFPLRMRRCSRAQARDRVDAMLAMVRLEGFADRLPQQLSGGQQQRVAVARALVAEPPVLLMDEPLSALDKKLRETMQLEIKRIQKRLGVTVVYVTHDQEEALTMSDRVAVMADGELMQVGAPIDLYHRPANAFVAGFIGKMNFLEGEYIGHDGDEAVIRLSQTATVKCPISSATAVAGQRLTVAIRPEDLSVRPSGDVRPGGFKGRVEAALFVGAAYVVLVAIDGRAGEVVEARLPANGGSLPLVPGDIVDVFAEPSAVRLFSHQQRQAA